MLAYCQALSWFRSQACNQLQDDDQQQQQQQQQPCCVPASAVLVLNLATSEELLLLQGMEAEHPVQGSLGLARQQSTLTAAAAAAEYSRVHSQQQQQQQPLSSQQLQSVTWLGQGLEPSWDLNDLQQPPIPGQNDPRHSSWTNTSSSAAAECSSASRQGSYGAGSDSGWWESAVIESAAAAAACAADGGSTSNAAAAAAGCDATLAPDDDLLYMFRHVYSMPEFPGERGVLAVLVSATLKQLHSFQSSTQVACFEKGGIATSSKSGWRNPPSGGCSFFAQSSA
jgi:hypothetical protein